ncbi:beta-galactosidase, partial [Kineococcus glutinatus]|uniref:beta-galactosidase n=1 Tax=Kineococcus glutinatus TaxID=1070872 RepID=UPI0031E82B95
MPADPTPAPHPLRVRHRPWAAPLVHPRMANAEDVRPGLALTSRYLLRDGVPWIPVSGEVHYSRVPRHRWAERLRQVRAGGVDVVASYVPWIHHVERPGEPRFDGDLDVAAFVDECRAAGLEVVLRIGPWVHAEMRNGGFPDWVQVAAVAHRTDDPAYLELVAGWFGQLAAALGGRCSPAGGVLGVQLENELYDQPGHLLTLKRLARRAGLSAPLWTATAWGSADLPGEEVLPVYGGYGDGFWLDADAPWDPTFRAHHLFSHVWDDPGIGADVRRQQQVGAAEQPRTPSPLFPAATCELGGGMATAYHRRPRPAALDVATVAHCKIGNGSAWQGYYMYAGGTNPHPRLPGVDGLQESHATGYPNDLPRLGYDFHAPIGQAGTLAPSHAELRRQHAFLAAFGPRLAEMPSSLPDALPAGVEDTTTLRWALRSDGRSGFLLIAWHQPHVPLATHRGARFRVELDAEVLELPSRPLDVPPGTLARWPLGLELGGLRLHWATASALTVLPAARPGGAATLVLTAEAGVDVELALAPDVLVDGRAGRPTTTGERCVHPVAAGRAPLRLRSAAGALDVLVLTPADAATAWVCEDGPAGRRLLLSASDLAWGPDGAVEVRSAAPVPEVLAYDPTAAALVPLPLEAQGAAEGFRADVRTEPLRPAGAVPPVHGTHDLRQSAPSREQFERAAAVHRLALPEQVHAADLDVLLHVDWAGDVAELRVDGRAVTDRFWDGSRWTTSLRDAGLPRGGEATLHLLPLSAGSALRLPAGAAPL